METPIEELTLAWHQAVRESNDIRAERNAHRCSEFLPPEYDEEGRCTFAGDEPCYRQQVYPEGDNKREADWCDECRANAAAHRRLKVAIKARGAALRKLRRSCDKKLKGS